MAKAGWRTGGSQKAFPPHLPPETEADRTPRESLLACMTASREPSNQSFEVDREATVCYASRRFFLDCFWCDWISDPAAALVLALQTGVPRHLRPTCKFAADENGELIRSRFDQVVALLMQRLYRLRRMHYLLRSAGKFFDYRSRRAGRRNETQPQRRAEVGHSGFCHGWHIRKRARPIIGCRRQCRDLTRSDLPHHCCSGSKEHRNPACDHIGDRLRTSWIRHVNQIESGALCKQHRTKLRQRTSAH